MPDAADPPIELVNEIGQRLAAVCRDFSPESFRALVFRAASIQWKYEQRRAAESRATARPRPGGNQR
ncbi:MAG TPA: hypothetical protein VH277_19175 [Gemmatimonadaceae bacterium]|jgi:hypothetical protein|nr:hypothetical protein [Gemmatimonadaceae bacterium]